MRRVAATLVALSFVLLTTAAPAAAAEPMELFDQITDQAGVLPRDDSAVRSALDDLSADSDVDLYVVFVPSFGFEDPDAWAAETAAQSQLEDTDVLLAVASEQDVYEYSWWVDDSSSLAQTDLDVRVDSDVAPALQAGNWDAAVIAMAEQLQEVAADSEPTSTWSARTTMSVVGGTILVLLAAHLFSRRRSRVPSHR